MVSVGVFFFGRIGGMVLNRNIIYREMFLWTKEERCLYNLR